MNELDVKFVKVALIDCISMSAIYIPGCLVTVFEFTKSIRKTGPSSYLMKLEPGDEFIT